MASGYDSLGDSKGLVAARIKKLMDGNGGVGGDGREMALISC